ncbi:FxsA family protein [Granulosicoccus sp. 3-233]|uniref:FxsA family protein n=1 Tax=Granulosicoccus sp. 3-233 TaxID=3417969 RepID=UPI003D354175
MPYVLLLFVAMPIIEIAVMLKVGDAIGWLPTLAIVILTAVIGTSMLRQQGLATLNKARQRLDAGEMPAQQMLEGMLLLLGGVLLLTPGFVTDAFGFLCLVPHTRQWLAGRIASRSVVSVSSVTGFGRSPGQGSTTVGSGATEAARNNDTAYDDLSSAGGRPRPRDSDAARSGEVIDADFKRIDDQ